MNTKEIANFIKESVNNLFMLDNDVTYRLVLDDDFALYIGWEDGFDKEDKVFLHSRKQPTYCICIKIAENGMDFSWEGAYMPWYVNDGEVYDTDMAIVKNDDYNALAKDMLDYYEEIKTLFNCGEITL